tara:strand:- start:854 stop:1162 length:309 start_codon:yes stop_codon:yes gene_type:complete
MDLPDCLNKILASYIIKPLTTYTPERGLELSISDRVILHDFVSELTGSKEGYKRYGYKRRDILYYISDQIERYGEYAECDNDGGFKTIVVFWLNRLPNELLF